jgi:hypothetical protein
VAGSEGNGYPQSHPAVKLALDRRMALRVRKRMKSRLTILENAIGHSAQESPGQASSNKSLQRTALVRGAGKSERSRSRLPLNSYRYAN